MAKKPKKRKLQKTHPMLGIWLDRLAERVRDRTEQAITNSGGKLNRKAYAALIGMSRQQLSIIENARRGYRIDLLLSALGGIKPYGDPVSDLAVSIAGLDQFTPEMVSACHTVIRALRRDGSSRDRVLNFTSMLEELMARPTDSEPQKNHSPPAKLEEG